MRKSVLFSAILFVAVLIGLAIFSKRNRSELQPQPETPSASITQETEVVSARVRLAPVVGTKIATNGQFQQSSRE